MSSYKFLTKKYLSVAIIIVALSGFACQHQPATAPCVAGSGGIFSLVVYAINDNTPIPTYFTHPDTAFIKFGTKLSPGTNPLNYDTFFVGSPREDHIHCEGLKCGDYFIYRTAWDSVHNVFLHGGAGITISEKTGSQVVNVSVN